MQVLASLASQPDGQKALLRTTAPSGSMLDLLLGLLQHHVAAVSTQAAAVLRNLALSPEAKTYFLSRAGALQALVNAMGLSQEPRRAAYAAGALWGLMYFQGEKASEPAGRCEPAVWVLQTGMCLVISEAF